MRFLIFLPVAFLVSGCASTHRITPLVEVSEHRPVNIVIKARYEPLQATVANRGGAAGALGVQFGFVGGFVGAIIDQTIYETRIAKAEARIKVLREQLTAERINKGFASSLQAVSDDNDNPYFADVSLVQGRIVPPSRNVPGKPKPRPRPREFPDDDELMTDSGITLVVTPGVMMSPSVGSLRIHLLATGYLSDSSRRVYQTQLRCETDIGQPFGEEYNAAVWNHAKGDLLEDSFGRCVRTLSQLLALDMFELRRFDMDSVAARKAARSSAARIPRGEFSGFDIYEIQEDGFVVVDTIEEHVTLTQQAGKWVVLDDELVIRRIRSSLFEDVESAVRDIIVHELYSEAVLDAAANRIWQLRKSRDDADADIVITLLESIEESGDARYRDFLVDVADDATYWKIRNYVIMTYEDMEDGESTPFVPAATSP